MTKDSTKDTAKAKDKAEEKRGEKDASGVEIIREDESTTVGTNAGPDAQQGTIADQDVTGTAPASHAGEDVDTNAGK